MDTSNGRPEKKAMRYSALQSLFHERHGHAPRDLYHKHILKCVIDLGEVYDETTDAIRGLIYRNDPSSKRELQNLRDREKALHVLSSDLRKAISISSQHCGQKEMGEKYERKPGPVHQSRPKVNLKELREQQREICEGPRSGESPEPLHE